jgi:glycosyltransferase involved in cell wall biosynthesis
VLHSADSTAPPLRVIHVLRAPVGGLFRHVLDLTREQIARGHKVGIIADSLTGGETAEKKLAELAPDLELGLMRMPIRRPPHPSDVSAIVAVNKFIAERKPDVVHGHGSKGGAYARCTGLFSGRQSAVRVYTPHGGSLNYAPGSMRHRAFMAMERLLAERTDALLFESAFVADRFEAFVGKPKSLARVIPNGVSPAEFDPVTTHADAADLLYVGEFRAAKGLDTLIDAIALLARQGVKPRVLLVGDGPDRQLLLERAQKAGVAEQITLGAPLPAREAFALGRAMVIPSRFESLPYIALEAAAAQMPLVATNVGGMGEIFGPYAKRLIVADDPRILADALLQILAEPPGMRAEQAKALADFVASRFSVSSMVDQIIEGYRDAIAARAAPGV